MQTIPESLVLPPERVSSALVLDALRNDPRWQELLDRATELKAEIENKYGARATYQNYGISEHIYNELFNIARDNGSVKVEFTIDAILKRVRDKFPNADERVVSSSLSYIARTVHANSVRYIGRKTWVFTDNERMRRKTKLA